MASDSGKSRRARQSFAFHTALEIWSENRFRALTPGALAAAVVAPLAVPLPAPPPLYGWRDLGAAFLRPRGAPVGCGTGKANRQGKHNIGVGVKQIQNRPKTTVRQY